MSVAIKTDDKLLCELEAAAKHALDMEHNAKHGGATFYLFSKCTPEMILCLLGRLRYLEEQEQQTSIYIEDLHSRLNEKT